MDYSVYSGYFNSDGSVSLSMVDSGHIDNEGFADLSFLTKSYCEKFATWCCEFIEFRLVDSLGQKFSFRLKPHDL